RSALDKFGMLSLRKRRRHQELNARFPQSFRLFDAYTGGGDYLELYNNSDKIVDLSSLTVGKMDLDDGIIADTEPVSESMLLLLPQQYICLTDDSDVDFQIQTYQPIDPNAIVAVNSFLTFDNTEGEVFIYTTDTNNAIDRLHYNDDWHFGNLDTDDGVSLERHDFNRATQDEDNWHSAASTVLYGTPGYQNSQVLVPDGDEEVWLEPTTFSPDLDGTDDVISVNYEFSQSSGWNARVTVFDNKGRLVRILQENTLLGTEGGTFTWDGTNDSGHKADIGIYVVLFEATNPSNGEKKAFKLGCVLAGRL
ncbi:MAG: FlgD immunoglobulin-like domain containing protein, partial [Bacteroidota bacterium]